MKLTNKLSTTYKAMIWLLLIPGASAQVLADVLDIKAAHMNITQGAGTVKVGDTVKFWCSWQVNLAGDQKIWKSAKLEKFTVRLLADGQHVASEVVLIQAGTEITKAKLGLDGTVYGSWKAKHSGLSHQPHKAELSCDVNFQQTISDHNMANNEKRLYVSVLPPYSTVQPGGWPSSPQQTMGQRANPQAGMAQIAKPDLVVVSATATPDNNCQNSQGARVKVQVRNAGIGNFPASSGNHVLFIQPGAGLSGGGVELPVLAGNQMVQKEVVLNTIGSPAQLAGKVVPLEIQLNKLKWVDETNHNNNTRKLMVHFPPTYCQAPKRVLPGQLQPQPQSRRLTR